MKNKKLLIAAAATALSAVLCFSACGGTSIKDDAKFSDIYSTAAYKEASVVTLKDFSSEFDGYGSLYTVGDGSVYCAYKTTTTGEGESATSTKTLKYYNVKTGKTATLGEDYGLDDVPLSDTYAIYQIGKESNGVGGYKFYCKNITVYNVKDDTQVVSVSNRDADYSFDNLKSKKIISMDNDFYRVDDYVYYQIDGVWTQICQYSNNANIFDNNLEYHEGYFYKVKSSKGYVIVYDATMQQVAAFTAPDVASFGGVFCLAGGDFIVQYFFDVSENSKDYNVFMDTGKYNYVTVKYDVSEKKAKEIDFDYIIGDGLLVSDYAEYFNYFNENVKGILMCMPIKDKQIVSSAKDVVYLAFDAENEFTLIPNAIEGQVSFAQIVSKDLFYVRDDNGLTYFVDANGENAKDYAFIGDSLNRYYGYVENDDDTVDLFSLYTMEKFQLAEGEEVKSVYTRSFITETEKTYKNDKDVEITYYEYKLYKDGAITDTVICDTKPNEDGKRASIDLTGSNLYKVVSADEKTTAIYNEIGDKLIDFVNTDTVTYSNITVSSNNYISVRKTTVKTEGNETKTLYYALTK